MRRGCLLLDINFLSAQFDLDNKSSKTNRTRSNGSFELSMIKRGCLFNWCNNSREKRAFNLATLVILRFKRKRKSGLIPEIICSLEL